jgi:hypothetical protein
MAIAIIVLGILSLYHFVYDSIMVPTLRLQYRYNLFALRDDLRRLKIEKDDLIDNDLFESLNNSINSTIIHLPNLNLASLIEARRFFGKNEKIEKELVRRVEMINNCDIPEIKEIRDSLNLNFTKVFLINMGSWVLYLLPIVICLLFILFILRSVRRLINGVKGDIQKITLVPEHDSYKVFTQTESLNSAHC